MGFFGAYIYGIKDDERFMSANTMAYRHILNQNPNPNPNQRKSQNQQNLAVAISESPRSVAISSRGRLHKPKKRSS